MAKPSLAEIAIVSGARTPMSEWIGGKRGDGQQGGALASLSAIELGAVAARAAIERAGISPEQIDHVIMGNALQTSADALYGARHVALKAGIPRPVPALTVNRLCGSGLQSVISAAQQIQTGEATWVVAGGMENLSQAPHVIRGARGGLKLGQGQLEDSLMAGLRDSYCGLFMAQTSDNLARKYGLTREAQDTFALRSHTLANTATNNGRFAEEIVPIEVKAGRGTSRIVDKDDHLFPSTTLEGLMKLPPAFGPESFVTAGNASGIVDGAAAVVVTSLADAKATGRTPMGVIRGYASVGVDPDIMGIGPAPAIRAAAERAGIKVEDIVLFEINEAFAGQFLAVEKELSLDREKVNVNGGAIGLGHPLGATGTRLIYTLLIEMAKRNKRWGAASACIGGGQGIAMIVERS